MDLAESSSVLSAALLKQTPRLTASPVMAVTAQQLILSQCLQAE